MPMPPTASNDLIPRLADLFSLLGDPSRLRIVTQCLHQPVNVSDLAAGAGLSQPLVSHHLRLLKAARLVTSKRSGKQIYYCAADHHVQCVIDAMLEHIEEDHSTLNPKQTSTARVDTDV